METLQAKERMVSTSDPLKTRGLPNKIYFLNFVTTVGFLMAGHIMVKIDNKSLKKKIFLSGSEEWLFWYTVIFHP